MSLTNELSFETSRDLTENARHAMGMYYQAEGFSRQGKLEEAASLYQACERLARRCSLHEASLRCLERSAHLYFRIGDISKAEQMANEGLAYIFSIEANQSNKLPFLTILIKVKRKRGDLQKAMDICFDGFEISAKTNNIDGELVFLSELVSIALDRGQAEDAYNMAVSGLRKARQLGKVLISLVFGGLAVRSLAQSGEDELARELRDRLVSDPAGILGSEQVSA